MCNAAPGIRCLSQNHLPKDISSAVASRDSAAEKLKEAEATAAQSKENLKELLATQSSQDDPAGLEPEVKNAMARLKADNDAVDKSSKVVKEKEQILARHEHMYDLVVVGSYASSKASLAENREVAVKLSALEEETAQLEVKLHRHETKIAAKRAQIEKLRKQGRQTAPERQKLQEQIEKLEMAGPFSRKEIQRAQELKAEAAKLAPLSEERRELAEAIVARGDAIKADGTWDDLRKERYVRTELEKYEREVKKFGHASIEGHFPNEQLRVDAFTMLSTLSRRKGGGGRELVPTEVLALNRAQESVAVTPAPSYLPQNASVVNRQEVQRPVLRAERVTTPVTPEPQKKYELPPLPPRPVLKRQPAPLNSHKVPGSRELARPDFTGNSSATRNSHKIAGSRELAPPVLPSATRKAAEQPAQREPVATTPPVAPERPKYDLGQRPTELRSEVVAPETVKPKASAVGRFLGFGKKKE